MSESRPISHLRQRRIRHIKTILGRNIVSNGDNLQTPSLDNADFPDLSAFVLASRSSSAVTSRASSPSPHVAWDQHVARSKSTVLHKRGGSTSLDTSPQATSSLFQTAMRRSESASSMRSITSTTTVEDSSMTKNAYKKKQQQQQQQHFKTKNCQKALCGEERGLLDVYCTLHLSGEEAAFYQSETIPNTVNPTFRALDPSSWSWYDGVQSEVTVRLWGRHSFPESASMVEGYDTQSAPADDQDFELIIEWQVDLNGLSFLCKTMQDSPFAFPENTLVFRLNDGFYTAPDIVSKLSVQSKRSSLVEPFGDTDRASIDIEFSASRTKRSYTYDSLLKINTLKACIFDTQQQASEVQQSMNELLIQEADRFRLVRERNSRQTRLEDIEGRLAKTKTSVRKDQKRIDELRQNIKERKAAIEDAHRRLRIGKEDLQNNEMALERSVQTHQRLYHKLTRRKKELIADLFSIYPIEQSFHDMHQFYIRGVHLPNSVYTGCNNEEIATALGFTAHLVSMLAFYLSIPLRYPIMPMGSRATIKDPVSSLAGSTDFPLYSKGVDKYRFEFGVFLLNKNIEQLMNAYGLIVMDLRHTLPNIHYFIQAVLTTSESSGPTSVSVLSISSYANQPDDGCCRDTSTGRGNTDNQHHQRTPSSTGSIKLPLPFPENGNDDTGGEQSSTGNRLTLQPAFSLSTPSPTSSTVSLHISPKSPKIGTSSPLVSTTAALVSASQAMAAPPTLDTVTTTSSSPKWTGLHLLSKDKK
ncbi:UV radiation resistance protein and autophagy-related subunit 14-domain-containing protein [Dichotomocladium elegans]|nr:UV radiation resistance protein and autophagy-related subunit 14-domain-containing protein [Dichotomocladium elegans]